MLLFHYLVLPEFKHAGNKNHTEHGKEVCLIRKKGLRIMTKLKGDLVKRMK